MTSSIAATTLFVLTNADGAEDFKIVVAPRRDARARALARPRAAPAGRLILATSLSRDHLVRLEREDALPRIVVRDSRRRSEHAIAFDEEAYALGLDGGYEFDTDDDPLHLFLDDDAGRGLRLRHADRARAACASARRCRAGTIPPPT